MKFNRKRNDPKQCQRYTRKPRVRQYKAKTTIPPVHPYENDDYGGFGEPEDGEDIDEGVADDENYPYDQNVGRGLIDVASNAVSQCPVENGVIRTVWGAVAAGPLIAGIKYFCLKLRSIQVHPLISVFGFHR